MYEKQYLRRDFFGFAENVWKLQGVVLMQNFKIFVGVTMNRKPLLFGQLMENKEVGCGCRLSGELL